MTDLLLADLHLPLPGSQAKASFLNEAFLRFCSGPARQAQRVFLLGDLFETWVGDDVGIRQYADAVAALRALSDRGVAVFTQTGNRDFLLGPRFAAATGSTALADEAVLTLADGVPTLLAHGDTYCTDDLGYQRWRRFSRHRLAQWLFLRLPVGQRQRIAGELRSGSTSAKANKPMAIMDVNASAIEHAFRRSGVRRLIHGHTHRPADHTLTVDGERCERLVLADWRPDRLEWLAIQDSGVTRQTF